MSHSYPQMKIRLPPEIKKDIDQSAKKNMRTLNAEIVSRLTAQAINLPDVLKEELQNSADKNTRTLEAEIIHRLNSSFRILSRIELKNDPELQKDIRKIVRQMLDDDNAKTKQSE